VIAIDAASGAVRWRRDFAGAGNSAAAAFAGGPVFAGRLVVAASGDGSIHAFDSVTGNTLWTIAPRSPAPIKRDFRPLVAAGEVVVAASLSGVLTGYDTTIQQAIWTYGDGSDGSTAPALSADARFVYVAYLSGRLVALDIGTGAVRWRVGAAFDRLSWPAASAGARVFASGSGGFKAFYR
jgi:outer membrane protein assembly factor BamB